MLEFKLLIASFISSSVIRLSIWVYSYDSVMVGMSARYCSKDDADNVLVQFQRCLKCSATSCFISAGSLIVVESSSRSAFIVAFCCWWRSILKKKFPGDSSSTWITERERTKAPRSLFFSSNRMNSAMSELTFWGSAVFRRSRTKSFLEFWIKSANSLKEKLSAKLEIIPPFQRIFESYAFA